MIQFPLYSMMSYEECYNFLSSLLHPHGLHCPQGHTLLEGQKPAILGLE